MNFLIVFLGIILLLFLFVSPLTLNAVAENNQNAIEHSQKFKKMNNSFLKNNSTGNIEKISNSTILFSDDVFSESTTASLENEANNTQIEIGPSDIIANDTIQEMLNNHNNTFVIGESIWTGIITSDFDDRFENDYSELHSDKKFYVNNLDKEDKTLPLESKVPSKKDLLKNKQVKWTDKGGVRVLGKSLNEPNEHIGVYKGNLFRLTEAGKYSAVDDSGDSWSFIYGIWIKDYKAIERDDPEPVNDEKIWAIMHVAKDKSSKDISEMFGYDRDHYKFEEYKKSQILIAKEITTKICPDCDDQPYDKINTVFHYSFPEEKLKLQRPEIIERMNQESNKAMELVGNLYGYNYTGRDYLFSHSFKVVNNPWNLKSFYP